MLIDKRSVWEATWRNLVFEKMWSCQPWGHRYYKSRSSRSLKAEIVKMLPRRQQHSLLHCCLQGSSRLVINSTSTSMPSILLKWKSRASIQSIQLAFQVDGLNSIGIASTLTTGWKPSSDLGYLCQHVERGHVTLVPGTYSFTILIPAKIVPSTHDASKIAVA